MPMLNAARKQLSIQHEVIRNIDKYDQLPTHDLHVGQHVMYKDSTSKQWYPQSNHIQPVKHSAHKKSSQVNNHLQVHTSRPKRDTKPPVKLDLKVV